MDQVVPDEYIGKSLIQPQFTKAAKFIPGANPDLSAGNYGVYSVKDTGTGGRIITQRSRQDIENENIARMIGQNQKAIEPAVESQRQGIGETKSLYEAQRNTLEGEKAPLEQRYSNLIDQITGRQSSAVNRQTRATSAELGARGISGPLAEQQIADAVNPLETEFATTLKDVGFNRESDLRGIANQIALSFPQEQLDIRGILNSIAGLQAQAGSTGVSQGLTSGNNQISDFVNSINFNENKRRAQEAEKFSQAQLALERTKLDDSKAAAAAQQAAIQKYIDAFSNSGGNQTTKTIPQNISDDFVEETAPSKSKSTTKAASSFDPKSFNVKNINSAISRLGLGSQGTGASNYSGGFY